MCAYIMNSHRMHTLIAPKNKNKFFRYIYDWNNVNDLMFYGQVI